MPKTPEDLFACLAGLKISVSTTRHPPLHTVAESQSLRGSIAGAHTKNLFLKDRKDRYFLLTVGEESEIDLKTIHHLIGASGRVSFGKPEALMELLGVAPGAVTAFGVINDTEARVTLVIEETLLQSEVINCHPLVNDATTSIRGADLLRFAAAVGHAPIILNVAAQSPD